MKTCPIFRFFGGKVGGKLLPLAAVSCFPLVAKPHYFHSRGRIKETLKFPHFLALNSTSLAVISDGF